MCGLQAIADRVQVETVRGVAANAAMIRGYDCLAPLFTPGAVARIRRVGAGAIGRVEIRARAGRLQAALGYFAPTTRPGTIGLDGGTASGRACICELICFSDGRPERKYAICHDRCRRMRGGWKFTERVCEVRYLDHSLLAGAAAGQAVLADSPATAIAAAPGRSARAVMEEEVT